MNNNYCWAYSSAVGHRSIIEDHIEPTGISLCQRKIMPRMKDSEFKDQYCQSCTSNDCKIKKSLVKINPTNQLVKQGDKLNSTTIDKLTETEYLSFPAGDIDATKFNGLVEDPNSSNDLFCQSLIIKLDDDHFIAVLLFDDRNMDDEIKISDKMNIKLNINGDMVDFGEIYIIKKLDSYITTVILNNMDEEDAIYCAKAIFKRIADEVFQYNI